jgi:hypothetical protein
MPPRFSAMPAAGPAATSASPMRPHRVRHRHMGHTALPKSFRPREGPVDKLVDDDEIAGNEVLAQAPTADNDMMSVTPQRFSASMLARKLISEGGSTCPRPWRGTNTTGWPSSDPKQIRPTGPKGGRPAATDIMQPVDPVDPAAPIIPIMGRVICGSVDSGPDLALRRVEHPAATTRNSIT